MSKALNAQSTMEHALVLIKSWKNADRTMFDPDADEEEYYNKCNCAFDNEIVDAVVSQTELSYEDNDYNFINHNDVRFRPIYEMWCDGGSIPHKKAELEGELFTGSNFLENVCRFPLQIMKARKGSRLSYKNLVNC